MMGVSFCHHMKQCQGRGEERGAEKSKDVAGERREGIRRGEGKKELWQDEEEKGELAKERGYS